MKTEEGQEPLIWDLGSNFKVRPYNNNNHNRLRPFARDYPGEPLPEETFMFVLTNCVLLFRVVWVVTPWWRRTRNCINFAISQKSRSTVAQGSDN